MGPCHVTETSYVTASSGYGGGVVSSGVTVRTNVPSMQIGYGGVKTRRVAQQVYRRQVNNVWVGK